MDPKVRGLPERSSYTKYSGRSGIPYAEPLPSGHHFAPSPPGIMPNCSIIFISSI